MSTRTFVALALVLVGAFALIIVVSSKDEPGDADSGVLPGPSERPDEPEVAMPPLPGAPETLDAATISGRVLDPAGGPMAGAEVALIAVRKPGEAVEVERTVNIRMGSGGMSARFSGTGAPDDGPIAVVRSGEDGAFSVTTTAAGPFELTASRTGFATARAGDVKRGDRDVTLRLRPAGGLRGLVTEEGGAPVPGAIVRSGAVSGLSDEEGRFELADIAAGDAIEVVASAQGYGEAKATVEVAEGGVTDVEPLVLTPVPGITGRVFDPLGEPLEGVRVTSLTGAFDTQSGSTDPGGRYHLAGVDAGSVDLAFAHPEYLPGRLDGLEYAEGRRLLAPDVRLRPGGEIVGRITRPEGDPVAGAKVIAVAFAKELDIEAIMWMSMGRGETPVSDAEGNYRIAGLEGGTYTLSVKADGFRPSLVRDIEVRVPEKSPVDVRLDPGLSLSGVVTDAHGNPVAGAEVTATTEGTPENIQEAMLFSENEVTTKSGADGRFLLRGLVEKKLTLTTTADGFAMSTLGGIDPAGEPVTIELARTGSISGLVLDAETGEPVAKADVSVDDLTSDDRESREDGTFTVTGVSPGSHKVTVNAQGYAPGTVQEIGVVTAEAETKGLEIRLSRGLTAVGYVLRNSDGTPIAEARVFFSGPVDQSAQTDATGRFEIFGLPPGAYDVRTVAAGFADHILKALAVPCDLDLRVGLGMGGTVRGVVRNAAGEPDARKMVMLGSGMDFGENVTMTGSDGTFAFENVTPGKYSIFVLDMRGGGGSVGLGGMKSKQVSVVEGEETWVEIGGTEGPKKARLTGRLLDRGEPVANRMFTLLPADLGEDGSGLMGLVSKFKMVQTDSEGRFDVKDLEPGRYRVFHGMMGAEEMAAGGEFVVNEGGEIEQDLELPAGTLLGSTVSALDGSPVSGATIMVLDGALARGPAASFGSMLAMVKAQTLSDAEGKFTIPSVEPGRHLVQVRAEGFAPRVISDVDIREQGGAPLALRLTRGHRLTVKVVDAKGAPIAGANVSLMDAEGHWVLFGDDLGVTTGADGTATLRVESGTWRIGAQSDGHAQAESEVRVSSDRDLAVRLPAGGTVNLVATSGGAPLAGARVRVIGSDGREIAPRVTEQSLLTGTGSRLTGEDGTLVIPNLPAGSLRIRVEAPDGGGTAETTVTCAEGEVTSALVDVK